MEISTFNPYTGSELGKYKVTDIEGVKSTISELKHVQLTWRDNFDKRIDMLGESRKNFEKNAENLANLMSSEMGKPLSQSLAEEGKILPMVILKHCTVWMEN